MWKILVLLIVINMLSCTAMAQKRYMLNGRVLDKTTPLQGAGVRLIGKLDTLTTVTDSLGYFKFKDFSSEQFALKIRSLGYQEYTGIHAMGGDYQLTLETIILKPDTQRLKEVVIEGKAVPVKVKEDTLEYNAAAYKTRENDRVEEIIKQLPGVEVDKNGNVSAMGKKVTKLRVDGKDFFTGDVKEFLKRLPADLIAKVQIIDDYGDVANITGMKTGEPKKIMNLVTKPNKNKGNFGEGEGRLGTNDQYSADVKYNLWAGNRQESITGNYNTRNNGAGTANGKLGSVFYNNKISEQVNLNFQYAYNDNSADSTVQRFSEALTNLGMLNTALNTASSRENKSHFLSAGMRKQSKASTLSAIIGVSFANYRSAETLSSLQTGIIHQDLNTRRDTRGKTPNLVFNGTFNSKIRKDNIGVMLDANSTAAKSTDDLYDQVTYYDGVGEQSSGERILNRLLENKNNNKNLKVLVMYNHPLPKSKKNAQARRGLNANYDLSVKSSDNGLLTFADQPFLVQMAKVDSLSTAYRATFITNSLNLSYTSKYKKLDYSIGLGPRLNMLNGKSEGLNDVIHTSNLVLAPELYASYTLSTGRKVSLRVGQNVTAPDFTQLQPVQNFSNLQNQVIGNPKLKPGETIFSNLDFTYTRPSGLVMQIGVNLASKWNQVVSNTILLTDTLNTLKQVTTYENADGGFYSGSNWSVSRPFLNNRYTLELRGAAGYLRNVFFAEGQKGFGNGFNFSQGIKGRMNEKWVTLNANINYSLNSNSYTVGGTGLNRVQTWLFNADGKFIISKDLNAGFEVLKTINSGYALENTNPLLVNLNVEQQLFKSKGIIRLSAFDLLKQGNNLNRQILGNTVTDTRTNQITRYLLLSFKVRLENFGG